MSLVERCRAWSMDPCGPCPVCGGMDRRSSGRWIECAGCGFKYVLDDHGNVVDMCIEEVPHDKKGAAS